MSPSDAIYSGQPFRLILRDLGLTSNQVWGLTRTDPEWSDKLEAALTANRRDDLEHGTNAAYRHGCACSEWSGASARQDVEEPRLRSCPGACVECPTGVRVAPEVDHPVSIVASEEMMMVQAVHPRRKRCVIKADEFPAGRSSLRC
jgi:hypothetical protein